MPAVPAAVPDNSSTMFPSGGSSGVEAAHTAEVVPEGPEGSHESETTNVLSNSVQVENKGDRNISGGNRWPRQETVALLKIRSQMDDAFRDSCLKAPLWEDVSRKLGELGYYRSAKKCKEKFENVYKYHRRTKEGRSGKQEGKTYRFFDELEAFAHQNHHHPSTIQPKPQVVLWPTMNNNHPNNPSLVVPHVTITALPLSSTPSILTPTSGSLPNGPQISPPHITISPLNLSHQNINGFKPNLATNNLFSSSTSSTASDEEFQVQPRNKRKRKWKYFFRRLTKDVLEKQEKLQEKFLEAIAKCENQRMAREEAWRMEEMARMSKEHEILAQERSLAAAKDAAVIEFLHKVSGQQNLTYMQALEEPSSQPQPMSVLMPPPLPAPVAVTRSSNFEVPKLNKGESPFPTGSTRWPRVEVEALINLRTCLDVKYQEAGPKGSLWEEISVGMKRLGYNRSAKRSKEKWENINKYYKKVKESSKTRSEDSKTCPYFHLLDILHSKKNNKNDASYVEKAITETMQPLIKVQPDQPVIEDIERENGDRNGDDEDGESTEEEDRSDDQMEMVTNDKDSSMDMVDS